MQFVIKVLKSISQPVNLPKCILIALNLTGIINTKWLKRRTKIHAREREQTEWKTSCMCGCG